MSKLLTAIAFLLFIQVPTTVAQIQSCDPAYPQDLAGKKICIPSPPPKLTCQDIPYSRFVVLPADPHGFDPDKNGIGCEG